METECLPRLGRQLSPKAPALQTQVPEASKEKSDMAAHAQIRITVQAETGRWAQQPSILGELQVPMKDSIKNKQNKPMWGHGSVVIWVASMGMEVQTPENP